MEALQRLHNRGSISTGFNIENSLKLEEDNTEYLHYTPSSQTDYERLTFSLWIKRTEIGLAKLAEFGNGSANTNNLRIGFDTSDRLYIYGNSIAWRVSNQVFRDTSAWYHLFFKFDTTQGTSNDKIRVWVNGNMIAHTDYNTVNNPSSGSAMGFNTTLPQSIGTQQEGGVNASSNFNGYIAQVWYSGGTPPNVTDFGEFDENSGIWKPIDISEVSIPDASGFFLDFSDSSDLGNDSSSNNNDFTLNNITSADQATDTPTNNFATWNPLWNYATSPTMTEGATKVVEGIGSWGGAKSSIGVANGKWYWELKVSSNSALTGIQTDGDGNIASGNAQAVKQTMALYYAGTMVEAYDSSSNRDDTNVTFTYNANDTYGIALDMDSPTQTISFYQNGSLITNGGNINIDGLGGNTVFPFAANNGSTTTVNFGGYTTNTISTPASDANGYGTFEYEPPSGYYALCTKNLEEFG